VKFHGNKDNQSDPHGAYAAQDAAQDGHPRPQAAEGKARRTDAPVPGDRPPQPRAARPCRRRPVQGHGALAVASSIMSPALLEQSLLYPRERVDLDMTFKNVMSVNVPVYSFTTKNEDPTEIYPYGFLQTSGELDDALSALAEVFGDMLELAQVEKTMQLLAEEIEKTRRRVNALEYVMIPEMQTNIKYISMKLEENDRSTKVRLMKVKYMVLQNAHNYED
jgi:V/A-type H+-transporting ATPase subunit D